jgi:RNA polymerase sigma-70 factor (ECF subfamily)
MYLDREGSSSAGYTPVDEFERVYAFLYSRVGNRCDAEDLTQQVAVKALPRLRAGAPPAAVRAYLFSTARSVLAVFWAERLRLPQSELGDEVADHGDGTSPEPSTEAAAWLEATLAALPTHYRQVLELRFLKGSSIREAAREMGRTCGAIKVMQLRALRAAATMPTSPNPTRPSPARVVPTVQPRELASSADR